MLFSSSSLWVPTMFDPLVAMMLGPLVVFPFRRRLKPGSYPDCFWCLVLDWLLLVRSFYAACASADVLTVRLTEMIG